MPEAGRLRAAADPRLRRVRPVQPSNQLPARYGAAAAAAGSTAWARPGLGPGVGRALQRGGHADRMAGDLGSACAVLVRCRVRPELPAGFTRSSAGYTPSGA